MKNKMGVLILLITIFIALIMIFGLVYSLSDKNNNDDILEENPIQEIDMTVSEDELYMLSDYIKDIYPLSAETPKALPIFNSIENADKEWIWTVAVREALDANETIDNFTYSNKIDESAQELFGNAVGSFKELYDEAKFELFEENKYGWLGANASVTSEVRYEIAATGQYNENFYVKIVEYKYNDLPDGKNISSLDNELLLKIEDLENESAEIEEYINNHMNELEAKQLVFEYDKENESLKIISSQVETNSANLSGNENLETQIKEEIDLVYDANYEKDVMADSYETEFGEVYNVKDIMVPFINIQSSYATEANNEIEQIYNSAIDAFNEGVNDKITYVDECNYKEYINDNKLSVLVTYGVGATDVVHPEYHTYNFNLENGNKFSYEEAYTVGGFNSTNIDEKVKVAIRNKMQELFGEALTGEDFENYTNRSIENYDNSLKDNTIKYFINEKGNLNVIVTLEAPAGREYFDTIIEVKN